MTAMRFFPPWLSSRIPPRGFSLIELLAVIVIVLLVMMMLVPAVSSIQRANDLTRTGALLRDQLQLARQLAIADNVSVFACLCQSGGASGEFNLLVLARPDANGVFRPIGKAFRFPSGIAISTNAQWSSLAALALTNVQVEGGVLPCRQIKFKPSGSAALDSTSDWFLTAMHAPSASGTPANFVAVAIDPMTGRVFSYQP